MRILHVNKFFDLHGGAEVYLHALMEHQREAGHTVHALSTRAPGNLPSADAARFVERFDYRASESIARDARKGAAYLWNRAAQDAMRRALKELQPDIVHLHNLYHHLSTSILAPIRRARIPCVQTLHDYKLACPNYKMFTEGSACERCKGGRYFEAVKHHCLTAGFAGNVLAAVEMGFTKAMQAYERTVHTFICPSQFLADKMIAWGEPPSKFVVVPNPVEVEGAGVSSFDIRTPNLEVSYILAVGRLSPEKGFDVLIRAAAGVPDIRIKIAGIGSEEQRLRHLILSLQAENVELIGFVPQAVRALSRGALGLAIPSVWYENAPLVVLEAMAEGLPILASRIGGLPELVEHGVNGFLVEPQDVHAWTEALKQCATLSQKARSQMGKKSYKKVLERFTWATHLEELDKVYHTARPCA